MNISIISEKSKVNRVYARGGRILEMMKPEGDGSLITCRIFDPEKNSVMEIAPGVKKYAFLPVENCIYNSLCVYFASYDHTADEGMINIRLFRYNIEAGETLQLCRFPADESFAFGKGGIHIFVLAENIVLAQFKKENSPFRQLLINTSEGSISEVKDINLIKNGVNSIVPVSETEIMLKTGFFSPAARDDQEDSSEALVETVYFGAMSAFIAALQPETGVNSMKMLYAAYYDKFITRPQVYGDFIYFLAADREGGTGETIFYNFRTGETIKCQNSGLSKDDHDIACCVGNTPCVRRQFDNITEFVDARTSEVMYSFSDEKFLCLTGELFIFKKRRGSRSFLRGYRIPDLKLAFEEEGIFRCACESGGDYFIYAGRI